MEAAAAGKAHGHGFWEFCHAAGRFEAAEQVDHAVPINKGGEAFPPLGGLTSLCRPCHSRKTGIEDRAEGRRTFKRLIRGYALDGTPLGGWD